MPPLASPSISSYPRPHLASKLRSGHPCHHNTCNRQNEKISKHVCSQFRKTERTACSETFNLGLLSDFTLEKKKMFLAMLKQRFSNLSDSQEGGCFPPCSSPWQFIQPMICVAESWKWQSATQGAEMCPAAARLLLTHACESFLLRTTFPITLKAL